MKVLLVNGSARANGCTHAALTEVARALGEEGIETEQIFIGNQPLPDCIGCRKCRETGSCVFDDCVNRFVEKACSADGFVFGSPVYFAHPSARLLTFMDRAFYSGGDAFAFKPAAAVLSARRAGTTASLDVIKQILYHLFHAGGIFDLLEPCLRPAAGAGNGGSRGPDDHV